MTDSWPGVVDGANRRRLSLVPAELSADDMADLASFARYLGFDEDVRGGDLLSPLIGGFSDVWLEAAVLSGRVPNVRGIALALRAVVLWGRSPRWGSAARQRVLRMPRGCGRPFLLTPPVELLGLVDDRLSILRTLQIDQSR
jgi:hypothetical protein